MAESDLYSVRCESCQTSFAPETKNCVHCGAPLGAGLMAALRAGVDPGGTEIDGGEIQAGRNWLWVVVAVMAAGFSLLRQCL